MAGTQLNPALASIPMRRIVCYHCRAPGAVSAHAISGSCPRCHRQLAIADIVVRQRHWGSRIETCGTVLIERGASVRVKQIVAGEGVDVRGSVRGHVVSFGPVRIADGASIDGDLEAPAVTVAPGATVVGGRFRITPAVPPR